MMSSIEAADRNRGRRPNWGSKGQKWRPQADNMAKIKRKGRVAICPLVSILYLRVATANNF